MMASLEYGLHSACAMVAAQKRNFVRPQLLQDDRRYPVRFGKRAEADGTG